MCFGFCFAYCGTKLECYTFKKGVDKATRKKYNGKISEIMAALWRVTFGKLDPDDFNALILAVDLINFSDVTLGDKATAFDGENVMHSQFACLRNYMVKSHTDKDGLVGVVGVLDPKNPKSRHIITHVIFPEFKMAIPLRSGDILVFDPRVTHCSCNPRDKKAFIFSVYTAAKTVHAHIAQWMEQTGM
jgi:hypothetical protein